tara:strand:- start:1198 stop:2142 length:945 start_codon:yes stop_codon:yes gene_type:complete
MPFERPVVNRSKIGKKAENRLNNAPPGLRAQYLGVAGDQSIEPIPGFISTPSEKVITNHQNSWIVLGRDRPGNMLSGKGGRGDTGAASLDMVVGRMSANPIAKSPQNESVFVDPDFTRDAARIYISQKTDIDRNFGLEEGATGTGNKQNRSAIGIKADAVRIIAREGIKIVSGGDSVNSQNARISELKGIELIVHGQDEGLQPLVKGHNLIEALNIISREVDKLAAVVETLLVSQTRLNKAFVEHWHMIPTYFEHPTDTSMIAGIEGNRTISDHAQFTAPDLQTVRLNIVNFQDKYLNDMRSNMHINSRHNKTT